MKTIIVKNDSLACKIALAIDDSHKNTLYHMFFGWRQTVTIDDEEFLRFIFSNKDYLIWRRLCVNVKEFKDTYLT